MSEIHDHIIIGSGCTGAMAAQTLVKAGVQVTMLDTGKKDDQYQGLIPAKNYLDIRQTEPAQHRYFIGEKGEGIPWGPARTGEHFTPPRKYLLDLTERYIPVQSADFFPMESLSYGGLGNAWGLGCCQFSDQELVAAGLSPTKMRAAYETVGNRIGISGEQDDATPYTTAHYKAFQPAPAMDQNQSRLLATYNRKKKFFHTNGFYMGRTALALLTRDLGNRKSYAYNDMDFYSDHNDSGYRPRMTVDELKKHSNFQYIGDLFVTGFTEKEEYTEVHCIHVSDNTPCVYRCRKLILASGALGTARLVLRSLQLHDVRLPLLSNPYSYIPCLQMRMAGKAAEYKKMGFSQLSLFHDPEQNNFDVTMASIYSYQSLMLFRIIKEAPLNFIDARIMMRYLMSGIVIMGIHHPDQRTDAKYLTLVKDEGAITGDRLEAGYRSSDSELEKINRIEKKYTRVMAAAGVYAIKKIRPGNGASIHYAGTMPFGENISGIELDVSGKLRGTKTVYIADGSGFSYLPAKGVTYSLMAHAHCVAENVLKNE